uniref:Syntrophin C-terminal PH domain-containing protein n=2 Tax=Tetranychus urticae TaxID=32264 RepID=T1KRY0_TETUR
MGNLVLDWRLGFIFRYPNERQYDWSYKFSQLKTSSDDGQTILWLSFRIHSQSSSSSTTSSSTTSSHSEINYRSSGRLNTNHTDSINTESPSTGSSETLHSSLPSITNAPTDNGKHGKAGSTSSTGSFSSPRESIENKLTIETREIHTNQLQNLLYCIHAFLTAKVISVDQSFLQNC